MRRTRFNLSNSKIWEKIILATCAVLFSLLLFKDVFSTRTLVPNLEPYPDSIHYINSAFSLIKGHGIAIEREGRVLSPSVPPLYSLALVPIFLARSDARMFYFVNILLAFISLFLLYKIIKKIVNNIFWIGFLLFIYITNYFIYWYPSIPMAENLTLTLFLGLLFVLSRTVSNLNLFLAAVLTVCLYFTKYASLPLVLSFAVIFLIKNILEEKRKDHVLRSCLKFLFFLLVAFLPFYFYELFFRKTDIITATLSNALKLLNLTPPEDKIEKIQSPYFSTNYFSKNFSLYLGSLFGKPMRFLWDNTPMVSFWMGLAGLTGLIAGLFDKKLRIICLAVILSLVSSIIFLSYFYVADGRYFYHAIPSVVLGMALFLRLLDSRIKNPRLITFLVVIVFIFYSVINFQRLKYQVSLNLRHSETPWYYVSVITLNDYFIDQPLGEKPIVISALPPYYVDFFSNKNYTLLPLSKNQEFPTVREKVWGPNDYSDLVNLYKKYLSQGRVLYVNNYGLGNEQPLHDDFDLIKKEFRLEKVQDGCDGACNIYKLEAK